MTDEDRKALELYNNRIGRFQRYADNHYQMKSLEFRSKVNNFTLKYDEDSVKTLSDEAKEEFKKYYEDVRLASKTYHDMNHKSYNHDKDFRDIEKCLKVIGVYYTK